MDNNTEDQLKKVEKPNPPMPEDKELLKIALLNARKTSSIGILLVGLPIIFILSVISQSSFHLHSGLLTSINTGLTAIPTHTRAVMAFIFIVGFPTAAVVLNLLSITWFRYNKRKREFDFTIKIRWWNLAVTLAGFAVACFYVLHLLADSVLGGHD